MNIKIYFKQYSNRQFNFGAYSTDFDFDVTILNNVEISPNIKYK